MGGESTGQEKIVHGQPMQLHGYIMSEFAATSCWLVDADNAVLNSYHA